MKIIRQLLIGLMAAALVIPSAFGLPTVTTTAVNPTFPTMTAPITIYVNINSPDVLQSGNTINKDSTVTAYTGLITSSSTDITTSWMYVKNSSWNDTSLSMTKVNDSIFSFTINDPVAFYGIDTSKEAAYRITFIARGTSNGQIQGQTNNLYFDVFDGQPSKVFSYLPANPTDKEMICVTFNLNDTAGVTNGMLGYTDTAYVHTWLNNASGPWTGPTWGDNSDQYRCIEINDSIRRWYIMPTTRKFFAFEPWTVAQSIGVLIRSKDKTKQTQDFTIPIQSQMDVNLAEVKPWLMLPPYPTVNDQINIFFDAKNYKRSNGDTLNPMSTLSAWSGLVTSASSNMGDWRHQVNATWSGFGDSTLFTRINDSIFLWSIPSLATKYNFDKSKETVYRIALIARDTANGAINKQTDDTYFEVYGGTPTTVLSALPTRPNVDGSAVITVNTKACKCNLADSSYSDTLYAHTGLITASSASSGDWKFVKTNWGDNTASTRMYQVNDSVYRYFIMPKIRGFYGDTANVSVDSLAFVFRSKNSDLQTANLFVAVSDTMSYITSIKPVIQSSDEIAVYPNPVSDVVNLKMGPSVTGPVTVSIYNLLGKEIFKSSYNTAANNIIHINISSIKGSQGILIYRIQTEKGSTQGKLIVY